MKIMRSVGVAPGTTTMQLGRRMSDEPRGCCDGGNVPDDCCNSIAGLRGPNLPFPERENHYPIDPFIQWQGRLPLGAIPPSRIRWDLIAIVGGGSLAIALAIGLVASALSK